jgi:hypothetical protein
LKNSGLSILYSGVHILLQSGNQFINTNNKLIYAPFILYLSPVILPNSN